jgi:hypothetical protein
MSAAMAALPGTARPARQVRPTMRPSRLRIHDMRCSVRSMPALLSSPNSPSCTASQANFKGWIWRVHRGCLLYSVGFTSVLLLLPNSYSCRVAHANSESALPSCHKELTRVLCQEPSVCSAMPCSIFMAAQEDVQLPDGVHAQFMDLHRDVQSGGASFHIIFKDENAQRPC